MCALSWSLGANCQTQAVWLEAFYQFVLLILSVFNVFGDVRGRGYTRQSTLLDGKLGVLLKMAANRNYALRTILPVLVESVPSLFHKLTGKWVSLKLFGSCLNHFQSGWQ